MGSLEGVLDTRSAWIGKHEVVEVRFRPDVTPYSELIDTALEHGCADRVWTTTDAQLAVAKTKKKIAGKVETFDGRTRAAKDSVRGFIDATRVGAAAALVGGAA